MVPGPPPARSVRLTLRLTTFLALRSSKQSIPRDFSSGAWSRKPKRPEAKALTETPAQSGCAFDADSALPSTHGARVEPSRLPAPSVRPREGHPATLASRGPRCGDPALGPGFPLSRE